MSKPKLAEVTGYSKIGRIVDAIANANGISPCHVSRHADLLEPWGLEPDDILRLHIHEAERIHEYEMARICHQPDPFSPVAAPVEVEIDWDAD